MKRPLRVAWFSVLNCGAEPGASVSAYTSDCLLPHLRERFEIELFHPSFSRYHDWPTRHYLEAASRHADLPFDVFFYQLEDSPEAAFTRIHVGLLPGVVLFHDLMFSSHGPEPILNSPWRETLKKFQDPGHPWPARGSEFEQEGPLGCREAGYAAVALFSNPASHADYRNNVGTRLALPGSRVPSFYLPLPAPCRPVLEQSAAEGALRIAYCGTPRIEHRAHKLCSALCSLRAPWQLEWLIDEGERAQAEAIAGEFGLSQVRFHCGRSPERWARILGGCNAAVHTLFSVFGQPGPYLQLSLMAGLPVLVTRFASCESLPDNLVWKIEPGETEAAEMREVLAHLAAGGRSAERRCVRDFAIETFDARTVAGELARVFENHSEYLRMVLQRWQGLRHDAGRALLQELRDGTWAGERREELCIDPRRAWDRLVRPIFAELGWKERGEQNA